MGRFELTPSECELIIHTLSTAQLSGDAAALRQALTLIDSIIHKLSSSQASAAVPQEVSPSNKQPLEQHNH
jgi:hypothetical protein